jgi:hypothetical protein
MPAKRLHFFNLRLSLSFITISLMFTKPAKRLCFFDISSSKDMLGPPVGSQCLRRGFISSSVKLWVGRGTCNAYEGASFLRLVAERRISMPAKRLCIFDELS